MKRPDLKSHGPNIVLILFILIFAGLGAKLIFFSRAAATCTTTVSSVAAAQTAVSSANDGDTVCVSAGSYGSITLARSGSHSSNVIIEPDPSQDPNGAGKVTFSGITVTGNYLTVHNFFSTGGITLDNGASNDVVSNNDVSNSSCGYGISVFGTQSGNTFTAIATNDTVSSNRIHDTGTSCEGDALRVQGYQNLTVTGNDIYNIQDPNGYHTDVFQSYQADVATSGLTIKNNYVHDTCVDEGFPFLKDGDIANVVIEDNLAVRDSVGSCGNPGIGIEVDENSNPITIRNNTNLMGASLENGGSAAGPTAAVDHNVLYALNTLGSCGSPSCQPGYALTENHNILTGGSGNTWSITPDSTDTFNASPGYKCGSACGNGTPAGDDYELASNPNGIGIDWSPASQTYGPAGSSGSSGGTAPAQCAVIASGTTLNYATLDACGYPSPDSTGVPSGTALTSASNVSCANTTINAEYITGGVSVGNNCIIQNSRIIGGITVQSGVTGVQFLHDEISGPYTGAGAASPPPTTPSCTYDATSGSGGVTSDILWEGAASGITLDYDYLHCAAEPFNGNGIVKDSYIVSDECWGPCGSGSTTHNEAVYIAGGGSGGSDLEHNTILNAFSQTAGIFGDDHAYGPIKNLTINNNLIADGGDNGGIATGNSGDGNINVVITNNRISYIYNANMPMNGNTAASTWCGNLVDGSSSTYVDINGGTSGAACAVITTDLNSDSHVNIFDLSIFLDHLGQTGTNLPGDFNSDGKVDTTDLTTLQGQWGR